MTASTKENGGQDRFEGTVKKLLRMKPKPHKEKGKGEDKKDERDEPARQVRQSDED